jgi:hypothetical protein
MADALLILLGILATFGSIGIAIAYYVLQDKPASAFGRVSRRVSVSLREQFQKLWLAMGCVFLAVLYLAIAVVTVVVILAVIIWAFRTVFGQSQPRLFLSEP